MYGTPAFKLVRKDDPSTSFEAAVKVDTSRLERMVYEAIKAYGQDGCISDQIVAQFSDLPYSSVTARYRALLDKGFIEDTGQRRAGRSGRQQRIMRAV